MRFRTLGGTGVRVSELCLGTMTFGGRGGMWDSIGALDERDSTRHVARALDAGVNFFDTANGYGGGESEQLLGRALGPRRKDVVVATKAGFPTGEGPNDRGLSRAHLLAACDASLGRLGTDWIDLYFVHRRDPLTPIEETMAALADLVRAGKVRCLGVSNWPAWQIVQANAFARAHGWPRFECVQAYYNLAARDIEREIVPLCVDHRMAITPWSPLAQGVLTGKYGAKGEPPRGARRESFELGPIDFDRVGRILSVARPIAERRNASLAQVALAWLVAKPGVTSVIVGARKLPQLDDNLGAAAVTLDPEEIAGLDEASELPPEYPGWFLKQMDSV